MSNTITDCLTGEQINFLKEHFFSFWSDNGTTDQKAIADMVAVSSLEDLNRLFDVIKLLSHCEMPANEISNFINSNIKFSIPLDESLLWLNRVVRILKVEYESKEILINVENSLVNRMRDKVAWLLNRYPETRDSDIALQLRYWEEFEGEIYSVGFISTNDLYKLSRLTTIARERARIQNQYRLFLGTERVRRRRKESEEQVKNLSKEDKPKHPVIVTFLDETGKTQKYLIIGGIWFLSRIAYSDIFNEVSKLKVSHHFEREFHFNQVSNSNLPIYKRLVDIFVDFSSVVSFKYISVENSKTHKEMQEAKEDLYFHILAGGVEQELSTGRIGLPRKLQIWIDPEETMADRLTIQNLNDRLGQKFKVTYQDEVVIDRILMEDSKNTIFLQIADLFIGCINRVMNHNSNSEKNQKDEIAGYFLEKLGIDPNNTEQLKFRDMVAHIRL